MMYAYAIKVTPAKHSSIKTTFNIPFLIFISLSFCNYYA